MAGVQEEFNQPKKIKFKHKPVAENSHSENRFFNPNPYNLRNQNVTATEDSVTNYCYNQSDTDDEEFVPNDYSTEQLNEDITAMEESEEFKANFALIIERRNRKKAEKLQKL